MKLKEINPGMVIRCNNVDEKKLLLEEAESLGYKWYGSAGLPTGRNEYSGMTIHFHEPSIVCDYFNITWSDRTEGVTEFSDLIIPDHELSAEEALLAYDQMCKEHYCCNDCPIYGIVGHECAHKMDEHITEIVDAIKKWKADREKKGPETEKAESEAEKKEPEIETVDICRIIEILPDGRKRCVHEEDIKSELPFGGDERQKIEEILKKYCIEHDGNFIAVHEVVSRVKAVE